MIRRLRAAWAALTTTPTTGTANTAQDITDKARAVQARDVQALHMNTTQADTHHGGQVTNTAHESVGVQTGAITGGTVITGNNSGILNTGGTNSFTNTTLGR